jgi:hypothetical protein
MRRVAIGMVLLVLSAGCQSAAWYEWQWPWQKTVAAGHEYTVPPHEDARFSQPPQFPKHTVTPSIKRDTQIAGPNPNGPPGVGPPLRHQPSGAYVQ